MEELASARFRIPEVRAGWYAHKTCRSLVWLEQSEAGLKEAVEEGSDRTLGHGDTVRRERSDFVGP